MQDSPPAVCTDSIEPTANAPAAAGIVCGTNFTAESARAVEVAAALSRRLGESLLVVHAEFAGAGEDLPAALRESLGNHARSQLSQTLDGLIRRGVRAAPIVRPGTPVATLFDVAKENHARLLVVAARRRRPVPSRFAGSVGECAAESVAMPTLVVRDAVPLLRWAARRRRLRVLVGADCSVRSEAALRWVAWLSQVGPCHAVVACLDPGCALPATETHPALAGDDMVAETVRMHERHFRHRIREMLGSSHVRVRFETGWGRSDAHLIELAVEERADLIVVGTHTRRSEHRLPHPSFSRGVLHYAAANVVCVPSHFSVLSDGCARHNPSNPIP
jgi:nucleotide-binding universal stress UspA family protein